MSDTLRPSDDLLAALDRDEDVITNPFTGRSEARPMPIERVRPTRPAPSAAAPGYDYSYLKFDDERAPEKPTEPSRPRDFLDDMVDTGQRMRARELEGLQEEARAEDDWQVTKGAKSAAYGGSRTMFGGLTAALGDVLGNESVKEWGIKQVQKGLDTQYKYKGDIEHVRDTYDPDSMWNTLGNMASWLSYQAGSQAVNIGTLLASGGVGSGIAKYGAKKAGEKFIEKQIAKGYTERQAKQKFAALGADIAATGVGMGMGIGETAGGMVAELGDVDGGVALGFGTLSGALDASPLFRVFHGRYGAEAAQRMKEGAFNRLSAMVKEGSKQSLLEGGTEVMQTMLQNAAVDYIENDRDLLKTIKSKQDFDEILDAAVAGFFMGGSMGVGSVAFRKAAKGSAAADMQESILETKTSDDLVKDEAALRKLLQDQKAHANAVLSVKAPEAMESAAVLEQQIVETKHAIEHVSGLRETKTREEQDALKEEMRLWEDGKRASQRAGKEFDRPKPTIDDIKARVRAEEDAAMAVSTETLMQAAPEEEAPQAAPEPTTPHAPIDTADLESTADDMIENLASIDDQVMRGVTPGVEKVARGGAFDESLRFYRVVEDQKTVVDDTLQQLEASRKDAVLSKKRAEDTLAELRQTHEKAAEDEKPSVQRLIERQESLAAREDLRSEKVADAIAEHRRAKQSIEKVLGRMLSVPGIARRLGHTPVREVEAAAVQTEAPTPEQKETGAYQKGKVRIGDLDVEIETPAGKFRSGKWGKKKLKHHYGQILNTEGTDGEPLDIFVNPNRDIDPDATVYVVNQNTSEGGFDEHKAMVGFPDLESAKKAYLANYKPDWDGLDSIVPMSGRGFANWTKGGRKGAPLTPAESARFGAAEQPLRDTLADIRSTSPNGELPKETFSALAAFRRMLDKFPGSVFANALSQEFEEASVGQLIGKPVRTAEDVAAAAMIYRSPAFETARMFFVKNGAVVHETATSFRLPNATSLLLPKGEARDRLFARIRAMKERGEIDGIYLQHNHPNGRPDPSPEDAIATRDYAHRLGDLFLGHVVSDHSQYGVITAQGTSSVHELPPESRQAPRPGTPLLAHDYLGMPVRTTTDLHRLYRKIIADPKENVAVIGVSDGQGVQAMGSLPMSLLAQAENDAGARVILKGHLLEFLRTTGTTSLSLAGVPGKLRKLITALEEDSVVRYVIDSRGVKLLYNPNDIQLNGMSGYFEETMVQRVIDETPVPVAPAEFIPTHQSSDGTLLQATDKRGVFTDAEDVEVEDRYAEPVAERATTADAPQAPSPSVDALRTAYRKVLDKQHSLLTRGERDAAAAMQAEVAEAKAAWDAAKAGVLRTSRQELLETEDASFKDRVVLAAHTVDIDNDPIAQGITSPVVVPQSSNKVKDALKKAWIGSKDAAGKVGMRRRAITSVMGAVHNAWTLADWAPRAADYIKRTAQMESYATHLTDFVSEVAKRWLLLSKGDNESLSKVAHGATILGFNPDTREFMGVPVPKGMPLLDALNAEILRVEQELKTTADSGQVRTLSTQLDELRKLDGHFRDSTVRDAFASVETIWESLPSEARKVFRESVGYFDDLFERNHENFVAAVSQLDLPASEREKMIRSFRDEGAMRKYRGLYFPMQRSGRYWVKYFDAVTGRYNVSFYNTEDQWKAALRKLKEHAGSKEDAQALAETLQKARDDLERAERRMSQLPKMIQQERTGGRTADVTRHESELQGLERQMPELKKALSLAMDQTKMAKNRFADARYNSRWDTEIKDATASPAFMEDVFGVFDSMLSKQPTDGDRQHLENTVIGPLREQIVDAYLGGLPELSARKAMIHREFVGGFNPDGLQNFYQTATHGAKYAARLKYGWHLNLLLRELDKDLRTATSPEEQAKEKRQHALLKIYRDQAMDKAGTIRELIKAGVVKGVKDEEIPLMNRFNNIFGRTDARTHADQKRRQYAKINATLKSYETRIETHRRFSTITDDSTVAFTGELLAALKQNYEYRMSAHTNPVSAAINSAGFFIFLGLSPAAWMINMLQVGTTAVPRMSARYGQARVWGEVLKLAKASAAYRSPDPIPPARGEQTLGRWASGKVERAKSVMGGFTVYNTLTDRDEQKAYQAFLDRGTFSKTQSADLSDVEREGFNYGSFGHALMDVSAMGFHKAEVFNREVTAMAAYRLEKERRLKALGGKDKLFTAEQRAEFESSLIEYAAGITSLTQGDYGSGNRAYVFQGDYMRVFTQFKQYAMMMIYLYVDTLRRARLPLLRSVLGRDLDAVQDADAKTEARKTLALLTAYQLVMGGGLSLFGMGGVMGIANMAVNAVLDDEEEIDLEAWIKQQIRGPSGTMRNWIGEALTEGVPNALGLDLNSRISLSDLMYRDSDQEDPKGAAYNVATQLLGPVLGGYVLDRLVYRTQAKLEYGEYSKAVEAALPNVFFSNMVKAMRRGLEGERNKQGETVTDVNAMHVFLTALGITPSKISDQYAQNSAVMHAAERVKNVRSKLMRDLYLARKMGQGDPAEVWKRIEKFNDNVPEREIDEKAVAASFKAREKSLAKMRHGMLISDDDLAEKLYDRFSFAAK